MKWIIVYMNDCYGPYSEVLESKELVNSWLEENSEHRAVVLYGDETTIEDHT